jgi:aminopeptidase
VRDPRIDEYARLLVDRSVGVQPGWQVLVRASHLARPLVESVLEQIAGRGAYPILQLSFEQTGGPFAREAPLELLREPAPLLRRIWQEADAYISIYAPENTREGAELSEERQMAMQEGTASLRERAMSLAVPWVVAVYPVISTAQDAGMTIGEFEEFVCSRLSCGTGTPRAGACARSPTSSTLPTRCASSAPAPSSRSPSPAASARSTRAT